MFLQRTPEAKSPSPLTNLAFLQINFIVFHNMFHQCLSFFVSFFIHMSGNTSKHHLNFMFMNELQHGQINSIAAITNTHIFVFLFCISNVYL